MPTHAEWRNKYSAQAAALCQDYVPGGERATDPFNFNQWISDNTIATGLMIATGDPLLGVPSPANPNPKPPGSAPAKVGSSVATTYDAVFSLSKDVSAGAKYALTVLPLGANASNSNNDTQHLTVAIGKQSGAGAGMRGEVPALPGAAPAASLLKGTLAAPRVGVSGVNLQDLGLLPTE